MASESEIEKALRERVEAVFRHSFTKGDHIRMLATELIAIACEAEVAQPHEPCDCGGDHSIKFSDMVKAEFDQAFKLGMANAGPIARKIFERRQSAEEVN